MKNFCKKGLFGLIFLSLCSLTHTHAQVLTPDLNAVDPRIQGLTIKYRINVTAGQTVYSRIELSPSKNFTFPQTFYNRVSTATTSYTDDVTESMGIASAPARYYVRIWSKVGKDSAVSIVDLDTTLQPVSAPKFKITQVLPNPEGAYFTRSSSSGNSNEKMEVTYKFSYDNSNFFPAGQRTLVGTQTVQDSVWDLFSNKKTWISVHYQNSVGSGDTVISFTTAVNAQKSDVTVNTVSPDVNDITLKGDITTYNVTNRLMAYWNNNKDSLFIGNFKSLKAEPWEIKIPGLKANTSASGKIVASSTLGKTTITWSSKTLPEPVKQMLTVNRVKNLLDGGSINWSWQTNTDDLFTRVDAKIYTDSLGSSPALVMKISDGLSTTSGTENSDMVLAKGTYWMFLISETQKGNFVKSAWFKFTLSNPIEPKLTVNKVTPGPGKFYANWSWLSNEYDLFTKVDAYIFGDSLGLDFKKSVTVSNGLTSDTGSMNSLISIGVGTYWIGVLGYSSSDTVYSNLLKFKITTPSSIQELSQVIGPVECIAYTLQGQKLPGTVIYNAHSLEPLPSSYRGQVLILQTLDGQLSQKVYMPRY